MIHYYYFINAGNILDDQMIINIVGIGASKQADRDLLFLTAYSVEHNSYFVIRSVGSSHFVQRLIDCYHLSPSNLRKVTARELVRSLKSSSAIPAAQHALENFNRMRMIIDSNYRIQSFFNSREKTTAELSTRKKPK